MNGSRPSCTGDDNKTPACRTQCESNYDVPYNKDLHYGSKSYSIKSDVAQIQAEIQKNGPVEGAFSVYADFPTYKSGKMFNFAEFTFVIILYLILTRLSF